MSFSELQELGIDCYADNDGGLWYWTEPPQRKSKRTRTMNLDNYECTGQLSLFEIKEDPKPIPNYSVEGIFEDGYREIREYDKPMVGIFDDLTAKHGIMVDFKVHRQPPTKETLQMPCYRMCDVGWCSLACFLRRGYIRHNGKWVRNENGDILISKNKECDWNPKGDCKNENS